MGQDELFNRSAHVHEEKTKGRDNTLGRHCANRAQLRRQGASAPTERDTQRKQDKISILRGSQKHTTWTLGFSTRHA